MHKTIFFFSVLLSFSGQLFCQSPDTLKLNITETVIDVNDLQQGGLFRTYDEKYSFQDVDYTNILYPAEPWNTVIRTNTLSIDYYPQFLSPLTDDDVFIIRNDGTIDVIDTVQRKLVYTLHNKFQIGTIARLLGKDGSVKNINTGSEKNYFWLNGKLLFRSQNTYILTDPYFTRFYTNEFINYLSENSIYILTNAFSTSLNRFIFIARKENPGQEQEVSVIFTDADLNKVEEYPFSKLTILDEYNPEKIQLSEDGNWLMVNTPDHEAQITPYAINKLYLYHFNPKFTGNISPMIFCGAIEENAYSNFFTHNQYGRILLFHTAYSTGIIKLDDALRILGVEKPTGILTTPQGLKDSEIHEAIRNRQYEEVKILLRDSANINKRGKYTFTPLHIAVLNNDLKIVEQLLDHNARVNEKALEGVTPLYIAVLHNNSSIARLLIQKGADPNITTTTLSTPLMCATYNNNTHLLSLLLEHGANPYVQNIKNQGPLFLAIRYYENPGIIKTYLKHDTQLNQPCYGYMSLLQLAIRHDDPSLVKFCIENGADVNYHHELSSPPLCQAIEAEQLSIIRILLSAGANIHAKNIFGKTAEELSEEKNINLNDL